MAFDFDGSADYVDIAGASSAWENFPDADWAIAFWLDPDSMGSTFGRSLAFAPGGGNFVIISNHDTIFQVQYKISSGSTIQSQDASYTRPGAFAHYVIGRTGNDLKIFEDNVEIATVTDTTNWGAITSGGVTSIGATTGGANFWNGRIAELAKWTRFPSSDERAAMAKGYSPLFFRQNLTFYHPFIRAYDNDRIANESLTNNGSTVAPHPPIIYPAPVYVPAISAVAPLEEKNVSDAAQVLIQETTQLQANVSLSDTFGITLQEAQTILALVESAGETLTVQLLEASQVQVVLSVLDAVRVRLIEVGTIQASVGVDDTTTIGLVEAASILETTLIQVADALSISFQEALSLVTVLEVQDALNLILANESSLIHSSVAVAEALSITIQDAAVILVGLTGIDDQLVIQLLENAEIEASEGLVSKNVVDTLAVLLDESTDLFKQLNIADTVQAQIQDQVALLVRTFELADTLQLGLVDQIKVFKLMEGLTDTLSLTIEDAASLVNLLSVSDTLSVILDETASQEAVELIAEIFQGRLATEFYGRRTPGPYTLRPHTHGNRNFNS